MDHKSALNIVTKYLNFLKENLIPALNPHPFDEEDFINPSIPIVYEILKSGTKII